MKTIQISDEQWRGLRMEAAARGVMMREVVGDAVGAWLLRRAEAVVAGAVSKAATVAGRQAAPAVQALVKELGLKTARELTVEPVEE